MARSNANGMQSQTRQCAWRSARRCRRAPVWLGAALFALLLLGLAAPRSAAQPLTPASLTIAGVQGDVVTRTLTLRLPSDAVELTFLPQELVTADGKQTVPATAIRATLPPTTTLPTTPTVTVVTMLTVTVDLAGTASGAYSGQAFLLYRTPVASAAPLLHEAPLALTVSVKQPGAWPLVVLVAGLLLGGALTFYRTQLRPRDQVLTAIGDLRNRVEADPELAVSAAGRDFRALADESMEAALASLHQGAQADATQSIDRATAILDLWQRQRANWLAVLAQRDQLLAQIPESNNTTFVANVRQAVAGSARTKILEALDDELKKKDWLDYVKALQDWLETLRLFVVDFNALEARANAASAALANADVSADVREQGQREVRSVLAALAALNPPADVAAYRTAYAALEARIAEVEKNIPPPARTDRGALPQAAPAGDGVSAIFTSLLGIPWSLADVGRGAWPRLRLWLFVIISFGVGWLLLAGAGYNELYMQKDTFGANWLGDYLALFAWGFGAEASRSAITTFVRGWGLPVGE